MCSPSRTAKGTSVRALILDEFARIHGFGCMGTSYEESGSWLG